MKMIKLCGLAAIVTLSVGCIMPDAFEAGSDSAENPNGSHNHGDVVGRSCDSSRDCGGDLVCLEGRCASEGGGGCETDRGCNRGEICERSRCVSGCRRDSDCRTVGQVCVIEDGDSTGQCGADDTVTCGANSQCEAGQVCDGGACTVITEVTCSSDEQCGFGEGQDLVRGACENGSCRLVSYEDCSSSDQCITGDRCQAGQDGGQVCVTECTVNTECDAIERCIEAGGICYYNLCGTAEESAVGYCGGQTGVECNGSFGETCNGHGEADGFCGRQPYDQNGGLVGLCRAGMSGAACEVVGNTECPAGERCHLAGIWDANGRCDDAGQATAGQPCEPGPMFGGSAADTCAAGHLCVPTNQGTACFEMCNPVGESACGEVGGQATQCASLNQLFRVVGQSPVGLCVPRQ